MAKNLKLNIKNAQLAEALNLGKFKKKEDFSSSKTLPQEEKPIDHEAKAVTATAVSTTDEVESHREALNQPEAQAHDESTTQQPKKKDLTPEAPRSLRATSTQEQSEETPPPSRPASSVKPETSPFPKGYGPKFPPAPPPPPVERREPPRYENARHDQPRPSSYPQRDQTPYRNSGQGYGAPRSSEPRQDGYSSAPRQHDRPYESRPRYDSRTDNRSDSRPDQRGDRPSYPPRDRPPYGAGPSQGYQSGSGSGQGYPPRQNPRYQGSGTASGYQGSGGYQGSRPQNSGYPPRQGGQHGDHSGGSNYGSNFQGQSPRHGTLHRPTLGPIPSRPEGKLLEKEITRSVKPVVRSYSEEEEQKKKAAKELKDLRPAKKAQPKAFDSRDKHGLRDAENEEWRRARNRKQQHVVEIAVVRPKSLKVKVPISVKDLAAEMKLKASQLIAKLLMSGVIVTLNDLLEDETTIQLLGQEFECEILLDRSEEERLKITNESIKEEITATPADKLSIRPPVVAFMGHVDHGKTSLIDAIRKSNIVQGEAGAITQHIGAFQATTAVGKITILDTPGHEAFSEMRARGADVTDIVVLVVAGDEGIKAQTIEAIEQAKAATVPIVVAINKCDKPGFNPENVYRQLADQNLLPEAWGGAIITVNCSAVTKEGIKELLEMLALQAEVLELRANSSSRARGTVIESQMHKGLGAVATLLVQNGTLRIGDAVVFATPWARVKTMKNEFGHEITEAPPSTPVKITGLSDLPVAGSDFIAVRSEKEARALSESRSAGQKHMKAQSHKKSLDLSTQQAKKILYLIVKADVQGSLEAMKTSLSKILSNKVEVNIISSGIGQINESDVELAAASKAIILGFHSDIESHAVELVRQHKVQVKIHDIIYHAVDDVKLQMKGLLDKVQQENETGKATVKAIFKSSHLGNICGCQVAEGTIHRNDHIKVMRNGEVLWKGPINSLKRVKEDVREVSKGIECGIVINYQGVAEGDTLQGFSISYLEQDI